MKKIIILFIITFSFITIVKAEEFAKSAKSGILIEYSTGKVLFEKNSNERLKPASMTKIMTLLLTMEKIDNNELSYDDEVIISMNASNMGGSQMFLDVNSSVRVEELIKGIAVASANDAAVALAEKIGGSVDNFVKMMNDKAKQLNLENTNFVNPHGLDAENHYSSAYDMSIMAKELIKHKDILRFTSTYEDYFNKSDGTKTWLVNTNKLVRFYPGVDGLKTGYTSEAGYCLTATAEKNGIRYITVLMGEESSDTRSKETTELLNYGFSNFKLNTILSEDTDLGQVYVEKGNQEKISIYVKNSVNEIIGINEPSNQYSYNIKVDKLVAPLKKGDIVGTVEIIDNEGTIIQEEQLTIKEDIDKISFGKLILKSFTLFLSGK